ncbi:aconitate hydratase AcnA [Anaerolineales bacterium HSG24]|nr:aconitate hydratase AcnA [Anaerolineales bacterium HSG24]
MIQTNPFGARVTFDSGNGEAYLYRLDQLEKEGLGEVSRLPFSIKVLLEAVLREVDGYIVKDEDVHKLAGWNATNPKPEEIPFKPARVILQDFTGVPAVVDLAAMRSAMARLGGDPQKINPVIPVNLVIDHSVQVDVFGQRAAILRNSEFEFKRNRERYEFLRWGQKAFDNFSVVPPSSGIVHQVNLEYIARGVWTKPYNGKMVAYPDSLVGTDSHTTMINGLGVVGWGVGGIEAEAVMLGQPIYMLIPEVVGFKLTGQLKEGVTATDLTLTVVEMLRQKGVVGKFVEFYGAGLSQIPLPDRATIANMGPEYGATMGFFPVDSEALNYMRRSGRSTKLVDLVERYTKEQGLFRTDNTPDPLFTDILELDVSQVEPSLAGPKRPQDRIALSAMQDTFHTSLKNPIGPQGFGLQDADIGHTGKIKGQETPLSHGAVVLTAITSCTNTSNPSVMLGAGILAKKAVEKGLTVPNYVKTSLAPGSRVVTEYLNEAGLTPYLEELGFHTVGYGCTTCIGNSGPLPEEVVEAITGGNLIVSGVLSGNRNFEGRIHQYIKANYLASPPLVVAYALAGTVDINLTSDPIGMGKDGQAVYLKDIWPTQAEVAAEYDKALNPDTFNKAYTGIEDSNEKWNAIPVAEGALYKWDEWSTYIQEPPFFIGMSKEVDTITPIEQANVLVKVGDSVTTDHISPAGAIPKEMPAGTYLQEHDVVPHEFNSFGSRRGNDRVMTRGTFGNIRLRNQLAPGTEGGWTTYLPTNEVMPIYDASKKYEADGTSLIVIAGKEYGTGSSRDWAAKGTLLLGAKAVMAESFERIHRSNLVGMGVLPLQFKEGENADSLGLTGQESYTIHVDDTLQPFQEVQVDVTDGDDTRTISLTCRIDTPVEIDYYRNGGILHTVLRNFVNEG